MTTTQAFGSLVIMAAVAVGVLAALKPFVDVGTTYGVLELVGWLAVMGAVAVTVASL